MGLLGLPLGSEHHLLSLLRPVRGHTSMSVNRSPVTATRRANVGQHDCDL